MEQHVELNHSDASAAKKTWTSPQLKKVDIEVITATTSAGSGGDFGGWS